MDISFTFGQKKFNYRVCAVIISGDKLLAMHDDRSPYFYLPGGRVKIGETAEQALIREVQEELKVTPQIVRPLWINQAFFNEDVDKLNYHEICIYFLTDVSQTDITGRGDGFTVIDNKKSLVFNWLDFNKLQTEYFYPNFIKKEIFDIPSYPVLRSETE